VAVCGVGDNDSTDTFCHREIKSVFIFTVMVSDSNDDGKSNNGINIEVKQSLYRAGQALRVPGD